MYADTDDLKKKVLRDIGEDAVYDLVRTNIEVVGEGTAPPNPTDELFDEILTTSISNGGGADATGSTSARVDATASTSTRVDATASASTRVDATALASTRVDATASKSIPPVPSRRLALLAKKQGQVRPGAPTVVTFQSNLDEEFER